MTDPEPEEEADPEEETKECKYCSITLPVDQFSINRRYKDGYDNRCKTCAKEKYKQKAIVKGVFGKPYKRQTNPHKIIDDVEHKKCYHCQTYKPLSNFKKNKTKWDQLHGDCSDCANVQLKKYNESHKEERKERYKKNNEHIKTRDRVRYANNEEYRNIKKERAKLYAKNNRKKINARIKERKKKDPVFATQMSLRSLFCKHISGGFGKTSKMQQYLGISLEEFNAYIEKQFTGIMTNDNRGIFGWHYDHIIPSSYYKDCKPSHLKRLWNYKNFRPLWWDENIKKGDKLIEEGKKLLEELTEEFPSDNEEEEFIYNDVDDCNIDDSFDILGSIEDFDEGGTIEEDTEEDTEVIIHKPPILRGTKRIPIKNEN